jgi:hypothetical protein
VALLAKFGEVRAGVEVGCFREIQGGEAVLLPVRQSGVAAAARGSAPARRWYWGQRWQLWDGMMGSQGGPGWRLKGGARDRGAQLGKGIPGGLAGDLGCSIALEGERKGRGRR